MEKAYLAVVKLKIDDGGIGEDVAKARDDADIKSVYSVAIDLSKQHSAETLSDLYLAFHDVEHAQQTAVSYLAFLRGMFEPVDGFEEMTVDDLITFKGKRRGVDLFSTNVLDVGAFELDVEDDGSVQFSVEKNGVLLASTDFQLAKERRIPVFVFISTVNDEAEKRFIRVDDSVKVKDILPSEDVIDAEIVEPDAAEPDAVEPDAAEPEPDAAEPDAAEPSEEEE